VRHDSIVVDLWALRELKDHSMWDPDRLHFSPLGHHTIAAMVLDTLNAPHSLEPLEPKPLPKSSWRGARTEDLVWAREYLAPWILRRLRHRTYEDRAAKRPEPGPVFGSAVPEHTSSSGGS
jgi:hypothetical protein